ncbi:hypothetical protein PRNP1_014763 [Phytophthora ramorum]
MREASRSRPVLREEYRPPHDNQGRYYNVLETRVMLLDEFLHEEEKMALDEARDSLSRAVPVLLLPGETSTKYERSFELWLLRRNVTMGSLRGDPEVERRFRLDFADSRAWELRRRRKANQWQDKSFQPNRDPFRCRSELLATEVLSADEFVQANEEKGLNGRMMAGEKLRPISMILNRAESKSKHETNFTKWLETKHVTLAMLANDPEEERRYRQCFAYARAKSHLRYNSKYAEANGSGSTPRRQMRSESRKRFSPQEPLCDHKEKRPRTHLGSHKEMTSSELDGDLPESVSHLCMQETKKTKIYTAEQSRCDTNTPQHQTEKLQTAEIFHAATETMARAEEASTSPPGHSLIKDYTRMSEQIALNSTAMKDALAYVKIAANINAVEAREHMNQIKELAMVISKEERRRDTALAAIIAQEWNSSQEELERLLDESSGTGSTSSSHEKLASVYKKQEANTLELQRVQVKLSNRLSWLQGGGNVSHNQLQEVLDLTNKLREKLGTRYQLGDQRNEMSVDLLRSNENMKMLTAELIEEAKHVWA